MVSIFTRLLGVIVGLGVIVWLIGFLLPRAYSIESTISIEAPPEQVFASVNDLRKWNQWSPWGEYSGLELKYSGAETGVDSVLTWSDPRGDGKLWITTSESPNLVGYRMFAGGFPEMENWIELVPDGMGTTVTWNSKGELPSGAFYGYSAILFAPGMQAEYDRALARLKSAVESH